MEDVSASVDRLVEKSAGPHLGLSSTLLASLESTCSWLGAVVGAHGLSAQEMLRALYMLQKRGGLSSPALIADAPQSCAVGH